MGLRAITLARLGEYVRVVHGVLKGETVEWSAEGRPHKIRFLNPELELINLHDPIPVHISAFGPRGRSLTAKLGAHWITAMRGAQPAIAALAEIQKAWQEAGRDLKALYSTAFGGGSCWLRASRPTARARRPWPVRRQRSCFTTKPKNKNLARSVSRRPCNSRPSSTPTAKSTASISRRMHATSLTTAAI